MKNHLKVKDKEILKMWTLKFEMTNSQVLLLNQSQISAVLLIVQNLVSQKETLVELSAIPNVNVVHYTNRNNSLQDL